jgi:photosystem II stability/assembly factor-like uncharacterized protein
MKNCLQLSLALAVALCGSVQAATYVDVLEQPARSSEFAVRSPLLDVTQAGTRLVSVGNRGHILYSDDAGQAWQQARVPVSVDLNAVHFPTEQQGWAVGNDGVILHSSDAGATWSKQLDGRQIGELLIQHYGALAAAEPDSEQWPLLVAEGERLKTEGADKPFLDVWFENAKTGYAVGVFNLILVTRDGGQHWVPLQDRTDNAQGLHLNAINSTGDALYLVGEQGLVRRWNERTQSFEALATPYQGSFFGVIGRPGEVLVYGLRGNALRSTDGGTSWQALHTELQVSITAAIQDQAGGYRLFTQAGHLLLAESGQGELRLQPQAEQAPVAGALRSADGAVILVGSRGVRRTTIE